MKKLIFILFAVLVFPIIMFAQGEAIDQAKQSFVDDLMSGLQQFFDFVNWLFVVTFIFIAFLVNVSIEKSKNNPIAKWLKKYIGTAWVSFIIGLILAGLFYWGFNYTERLEGIGLFFSILLSMVIYQIGIKKVLQYIGLLPKEEKASVNNPANPI